MVVGLSTLGTNAAPAAALPAITAQPQNQIAAPGGTALFHVTVAEGDPVSYEWWNEAGPLYPPQTGATLSLSQIQPADAGLYKVQVRNAAGTVTSSSASLVVNASVAGNYLIARKRVGTGIDPGGNVDLDSAGNVYVCGAFTGTATLGGFTLGSVGGSDIFIAKLDRTGSVVWARRAGGTGNDTGVAVAVDRMGNIHVTGSFQGTADIGGIAVTGGGTGSSWIAVLDRDGTTRWARNVGGSGVTRAHRLACDAAGNTVLLGSYTATVASGETSLTSAGESDVLLAKFSASGVPLWMKSFGGAGSDYGTGLALDPTGNIFLTGTFQDTARFGAIQLGGDLISQSFLVKCDRTGIVTWATKITNIDSDAGTTVVAENDGSCDVTGTFSALTTIGRTTLTNREPSDPFVAKYDGQGHALWAARAGGVDSKLGLQPADMSATSAFGTGALDWNSGGQVVDLIVVNYSQPGVVAWARRTGASQASFSLGLMTDGSGKRYLTGFFEPAESIPDASVALLAQLSLARAVGPPPPLITGMPQPKSVIVGNSATFGVTATGASALAYRWRFNGVEITGATGASLTIRNAQLTDAGSYSVVTFNVDGSATSSEALLTVQSPPDVTPPTIAITAPTAGARFQTPSILLRGTAGDAGGVQRVEVQLGNDAVQWATGTTIWSAPLTLVEGTNSVQARCVDIAGNVSAWVSRKFVLATNRPPVLTNALVLAKGGYHGLFYEVAGVEHPSSGGFSIATSPGGRYTAVFTPGGTRFALSGRFDPNGNATNIIRRAGTNVLTVVLHLLSSNNVDQVVGEVSGGDWVAELSANRDAPVVVGAPAAWTGRYTLAIPGETDSPASPGGSGFGSAVVDARGRLSLVATLGDGTKFSQAVPLSSQGQWPLFGRLYAGKGSVLGWVEFADRPTDDFLGLLSWISPAQPKRRSYPGGYEVNRPLVGSRYLRPIPNTSPVLAMGSGLLQLKGGNLPSEIVNDVLLSTNNKVTNLSSNKLSLSLTLSSGQFSGRVVDPATGKAIPFKGAVLQKRLAGFGLFTGTNQTGRVELGP